MTILITGATGFVGTYLTELLVGRGEKVIGLSRRGSWPGSSPAAVRAVPLAAVDVTDFFALCRLLNETKPDQIFHLAAQANVPESVREPEQTWNANYLGTRRLFDAAIETVPNASILYVSSGNVYGQPPPAELPISEQTVPRPTTPYGQSKLAAELLAKKYVDQLGCHIFIARPFNHAGPRQASSYALSHFAKQIARLERQGSAGMLAVGNLQVFRDFSDVRDVVRAYTMILDKGTPGDVYNVASGASTKLEYALEQLLAMSSCQINVVQDPELIRDNDLSRIEVDNRRLCEQTGWKPQIPLQKTLQDTLDFWRKCDHES